MEAQADLRSLRRLIASRWAVEVAQVRATIPTVTIKPAAELRAAE
jgi:hypothetical protein